MAGLPLTVTEAGLAALINAQATGASAAVISHIGISATAFTPTVMTTAIPGELKRLGAVSGQLVDARTIHVSVLDSSADVYDMRTIGLYLNTGVLLAVYSQPDIMMQKASAAWAIIDADLRLLTNLAANITFSGGGWTNPPATETVMGVAKLATEAEALGGADAVRIITSKTLAAVAALKTDKVRTVTGGGLLTGGGDLSADRVLTLAEASDAEASAGADGTKAITSRRLATVAATKADKARTVTGGGLVTGGGDLSANRVLTVTEASDAEAIAGTDATKVITPRRLAAAVAALINGAPGALDTLNELAAALGNDANFAATMTNALSLKADKARSVTGGGLVTGGGDLTADRTLTVTEASDVEMLAGVSSTKAATPRRVKTAIDARFFAGAVEMFAGSAAPAGYLECDGAAVSRATYAALFTAIGVVYGAGDGATTFNVPDLRGEFVRGWDHGRGADPARTLGSAQADELKSHSHSLPVHTDANAGDGNIEDSDGTGAPRTASTGATGGSETRPRNIALMFIIKA